MNIQSLVFLAICTLFLLSVRTTDAMKCYVCTNCNDPFDQNGQVMSIDCTGSCTKTKIGGMVTRGCMPLLEKNECDEKGDAENCWCTENKCNSSNSLAVSFVVSGFLATINSLYNIFM